MKYTLLDQDTRASNIYESHNQVVTHLNIKENEEIPIHESPMSVVVVIYEGQVDFNEDGNIYNIKPGDIIKLEPGVKHGLKAIKSSKLMVIKSNLSS